MQVMQVLECRCRLVETTDLEVSDAAHRILEHKRRGEQLEAVAETAKGPLAAARH